MMNGTPADYDNSSGRSLVDLNRFDYIKGKDLFQVSKHVIEHTFYSDQEVGKMFIEYCLARFQNFLFYKVSHKRIYRVIKPMTVSYLKFAHISNKLFEKKVWIT